MRVYLRVSLFVLLLVGFFVLIGQSIPQVSSRPPQALTPEEFGKLGPQDLVRKGKEIFGMAGERCSQCHIVGEGTPGRGPNLTGIGARAGERARERATAAGRPFTAEDYLVESLLDPKAYVVKDYPPIMPPVYQPPLELSSYDIRALVAYLESLGGELTMTSKTELPPEYQKRILAAASAPKGPLGDPRSGKDLFFNGARCIACHKVGKSGGVQGPELTAIGAINTPDYMRESIVDPNAVIVTGYERDVMELHYAKHLTEKEVNDLVAYLMSLKG